MDKNGSSRILTNTLALYVRMIILTIISLFTYRVVFRSLGASDYGTYNVVGGFVSMFNFVSGTLIIASQRYFAVGLASGDWDVVNRYFSVNMVIYVLLSAVILLLAETVGLWFVTTRLNVDYSRMTDIVIVYETSIFTFLIGMLVSPFLALLVADENLSIYSWISIIEGFLKICVAYVLYAVRGNRLSIYAFLLLFVSIVINGTYVIYCLKKYRKLRFTICRDKEEYRSVFTFINWNMIGAIAAVCKSQGINIIINIFFGTVVNAARAVAYQLNATISSFTQNFMKAVDPHITKTYANGDEGRFLNALYTSSKISYYLLLAIAVPFIATAEFVLTLWLGEIPEYTVIFTVLALTDALVLSITEPVLTAVQAVGKVKEYQLTVGILALLNLPLSYLALKLTSNPLIPFVVAILLDAFITIGRLVNFKRLHPFSISKYCIHILVPALLITAASVWINMNYLSNAGSFGRLVANVAICEVIMAALIFTIGLNQRERLLLKNLLPFKRRV